MIKKLFILIFMCGFLFSKDMIHMYRQNGLKGVEKHIEGVLADKSYWEDKLEDGDFSLGYYETDKYILVENKKEKILKLFIREDNKYEKVLSYPSYIGENSGDKEKRGDKKTPIGVYRLLEVLTKKNDLDQYYGSLALVTSYPNLFDRIRGKTGGGIWVHGFPFSGERPSYTRGCIAIENDDIVRLNEIIDIKKSVLIIDQDEITKTNKDELSFILANLYKWRNAWKYSDINTYLNFYSKDFKKLPNLNYTKFAEYKKNLFQSRHDKNIVFKNINITPYPLENEYKKLFWVRFYESYSSVYHKFSGMKTLLISIENKEFKIITES